MSAPRRFALWVALGAAAAALLAVALVWPNRTLVPLALFVWRWPVPMWAVLFVSFACGALAGAGAVARSWRAERSRRLGLQRELDGLRDEVGELRRLLAREAVGGDDGSARLGPGRPEA